MCRCRSAFPTRTPPNFRKKLKVYSTPIANTMHVVGLNYTFEPFQDPNVRKAIAYAIPYKEIFETAAYGRGAPLWGGDETIEDTAWPRKSPYFTDMDKAKELLAASNYPDGFEVPIFDQHRTWPRGWSQTALLIQEALGKLGIKTEIEKIPGANWRTAVLVEKRLPLHLENFGGWLDTPDYYFFWAYQEGNLFNSSNYRNEEIEKLTAETLPMAQDDPDYAPKIKRMFEIVFEDLPRIPALSTRSQCGDEWCRRIRVLVPPPARCPLADQSGELSHGGSRVRDFQSCTASSSGRGGGCCNQLPSSPAPCPAIQQCNSPEPRPRRNPSNRSASR